MRRTGPKAALPAAAVSVGLILVVISTAVPVLLLLGADDRTLSRWADVGQAVGPVGIFFSGVAFIGIALTLALQQRELQNQREDLTATRDEQQRVGEIALRQLHTDLIKMAIDDPELRSVWPEMAPGIESGKKDHYCNLILNLQKVAYEANTIGLDELSGALRFLMTSRDIYAFWAHARAGRAAITGADDAEDFFTRQVDLAHAAVGPPPDDSARPPADPA